MIIPIWYHNPMSETPKPKEWVNHPQHYNVGSIETIAYLESLGIAEDFCAGSAIKYLSRYKHKEEALKDLKKARWYIDKIISYYEKKVAP